MAKISKPNNQATKTTQAPATQTPEVVKTGVENVTGDQAQQPSGSENAKNVTNDTTEVNATSDQTNTGVDQGSDEAVVGQSETGDVAADQQVNNDAPGVDEVKEVKVASAQPIVDIPKLPEIVIEKSFNEVQEEMFTEIDNALKRVLVGVSADKVALFAVVTNYIRKMAPRQPMTIEDGRRYQASFSNILKVILNQKDTDGDFDKCLTALLRVFDLASKSTLSEHYVFRFLEHVEMTTEDIGTFTRIVNLLSITAPVKGRKEALKQIDFNKTLRTGFSDEARQRIMNFYGA